MSMRCLYPSANARSAGRLNFEIGRFKTGCRIFCTSVSLHLSLCSVGEHILIQRSHALHKVVKIAPTMNHCCTCPGSPTVTEHCHTSPWNLANKHFNVFVYRAWHLCISQQRCNNLHCMQESYAIPDMTFEQTNPKVKNKCLFLFIIHSTDGHGLTVCSHQETRWETVHLGFDSLVEMVTQGKEFWPN